MICFTNEMNIEYIVRLWHRGYWLQGICWSLRQEDNQGSSTSFNEKELMSSSFKLLKTSANLPKVLLGNTAILAVSFYRIFTHIVCGVLLAVTMTSFEREG